MPQWSTANHSPQRPKPGHHLVGDEHDAVLVAELTHALEVAVGRHEDAVGADHRLEDDRRHRVRALDHEGVAQVLEGPVALLLLALGVEGRAVGVGTPEVHDARLAGL